MLAGGEDADKISLQYQTLRMLAVIEMCGPGPESSCVNNDPIACQLSFGSVGHIHTLQEIHQLRVRGRIMEFLALNGFVGLLAIAAGKSTKRRSDNGYYWTHGIKAEGEI
jgi:hypothetical protein